MFCRIFNIVIFNKYSVFFFVLAFARGSIAEKGHTSSSSESGSDSDSCEDGSSSHGGSDHESNEDDE